VTLLLPKGEVLGLESFRCPAYSLAVCEMWGPTGPLEPVHALMLVRLGKEFHPLLDPGGLSAASEAAAAIPACLPASATNAW
jgi:hypothetical protein